MCVLLCWEWFQPRESGGVQVRPTVLSASLPHHSQAKWPALCHSLDLLVPGAVCESAGRGEKKAGVIHSSLQPLLSYWGIITETRSRPWGLVTIPTIKSLSCPAVRFFPSNIAESYPGEVPLFTSTLLTNTISSELPCNYWSSWINLNRSLCLSVKLKPPLGLHTSTLPRSYRVFTTPEVSPRWFTSK